MLQCLSNHDFICILTRIRLVHGTVLFCFRSSSSQPTALWRSPPSSTAPSVCCRPLCQAAQPCHHRVVLLYNLHHQLMLQPRLMPPRRLWWVQRYFCFQFERQFCSQTTCRSESQPERNQIVISAYYSLSYTPTHTHHTTQDAQQSAYEEAMKPLQFRVCTLNLGLHCFRAAIEESALASCKKERLVVEKKEKAKAELFVVEFKPRARRRGGFSVMIVKCKGRAVSQVIALLSNNKCVCTVL